MKNLVGAMQMYWDPYCSTRYNRREIYKRGHFRDTEDISNRSEIRRARIKEHAS